MQNSVRKLHTTPDLFESAANAPGFFRLTLSTAARGQLCRRYADDFRLFGYPPAMDQSSCSKPGSRLSNFFGVAGTPATSVCSGTSLVTTAPAPTTE